ncbi:hypothetical protein GCM10007320_29840 [Pseudorhodoferax aquiterrae]|uniref:CoA transferase n=1 Tax=Pseudorhodoferax aquiterrae TaxID=747304 RepID=A0ABQ3G3P5_9BURK|nr:hypothetical protein GCM10007320_29840 [Pseudorhodoferax aquiterrae]
MEQTLPLSGIRVLEFTHMVMGPTCGMVLADLGAEVIKVEPPGGDKTRRLPGLGIGFFRSFNRNKKSIVLDITGEEGRAAAAELAGQCDVVLENFRPGLMAQLGLDYATLSARFPRLIYVTHKGFLPGLYENRLALDEVVQMMGGLSYMTGPVGRPLRAGTSVNDIMGGLFGAIGVLAALRERERTGKGQEVQSALFENCVFLASQHMQQYLIVKFRIKGRHSAVVVQRKLGFVVVHSTTKKDAVASFRWGSSELMVGTPTQVPLRTAEPSSLHDQRQTSGIDRRCLPE